MKNLSVFILARKILFCSIILQHAHVLLPLTAPVRLDYGYRREGEGSCGSWKLNMLKKGSGIFVAEEGVFPLPPNQLLYSLDQRKTGENVLETYKNHLLSISLIVIKYKIVHYTEVLRINIH
jgi:hypothetical protein